MVPLKAVREDSPTATKAALAAIVFLCAVLLHGHVCAGERRPASGEINAATIYHNYCSVCHGDRGDGRSRARASLVPPPRDFTTAQDLTRAAMIAMITDGKPGTAMAAWKTQLNDREIAAVTDFIRATFMRRASASVNGHRRPAYAADISGSHAHGGRARDARAGAVPPEDFAAPMPRGLAGDARRGEVFYMANCATCHNHNGDGDGPRAYFIRPKPRNLIAPDARAQLSRPALFVGIAMGKTGTEMPAWSKVLNDQELADVAEFVFVRFIRPADKQ